MVLEAVSFSCGGCNYL